MESQNVISWRVKIRSVLANTPLCSLVNFIISIAIIIYHHRHPHRYFHHRHHRQLFKNTTSEMASRRGHGTAAHSVRV
jgi:hypothetical protein